MNSADGVGRYSFVGNIFFHDIRWRPLPSTPVNMKGVQDIVQHIYSDGVMASNVSSEIIVAVE
eukprot:10790478-Lingulodinium_polyedra.AAC.1